MPTKLDVAVCLPERAGRRYGPAPWRRTVAASALPPPLDLFAGWARTCYVRAPISCWRVVLKNACLDPTRSTTFTHLIPPRPPWCSLRPPQNPYGQRNMTHLSPPNGAKSATILQTQPMPITLSKKMHWNASYVCWRDGATFCAETPLSLSKGLHPVFVRVAGAHYSRSVETKARQQHEYGTHRRCLAAFHRQRPAVPCVAP